MPVKAKVDLKGMMAIFMHTPEYLLIKTPTKLGNASKTTGLLMITLPATAAIHNLSVSKDLKTGISSRLMISERITKTPTPAARLAKMRPSKP